jgi:cholesterol transport system auxiliary component
MTSLLRSRRRVLGAAACLVPLAGCSLLFPPSAPQLYRLTPQSADAPHGPLVRSQLVVDAPTAPESLDTDRIALTRNQIQLDYFASSAWTDTAPRLLQGLLIDAFQSSGRIVAVGRGSSDLNPDYLLETDLRDFQARYAGSGNQPPTSVVTVDAELVQMPGRRVIGSILAAKEAPASRNDLDSIVEAFDAATGEVISQIVDWTLGRMVRGR